MTNDSGSTAISARATPDPAKPAPASAKRRPAAKTPAGAAIDKPAVTRTADPQPETPAADTPVADTPAGSAVDAATGSAPAARQPTEDETPTSLPPAAPEKPVPSVSLPTVGLLAVLALGWLVAMLWSAQATISAGAGGLAITAAAYSLPGVISAVLVGGAALGLVAVASLDRWSAARPVERAGLRSAAAFGAGLVTGVGGATTVIATYGTGTASMVLAGTVAAAGTIGGAVAALRAQHLVASAVAAALAVFTVGFVLNLFKSPLLSLYGLGETEASRLSAYGWFAATAAIGSGIAAGLVAFGILRWAGRGGVLRWPAYLVAGAGPGLMLLVAELITRIGGARVLSLAGEVSDNDRTAQAWLDGSRINYALVVLFVGAIVAVVAFGRTLQPPAAPDDEED